MTSSRCYADSARHAALLQDRTRRLRMAFFSAFRRDDAERFMEFGRRLDFEFSVVEIVAIGRLGGWDCVEADWLSQAVRLDRLRCAKAMLESSVGFERRGGAVSLAAFKLSADAGASCSAEMAGLLLDHLPASARDERGGTLLHFAARCRARALAELALARREIDVDAIDNDGLTPLWLAVEANDTGVARALIKTGGAKVRLRDNKGRSLLRAVFALGEQSESFPDAIPMVGAAARKAAEESPGWRARGARQELARSFERAVAARRWNVALAIAQGAPKPWSDAMLKKATWKAHGRLARALFREGPLAREISVEAEPLLAMAEAAALRGHLGLRSPRPSPARPSLASSARPETPTAPSPARARRL
jgi:hypothetical protein